MLVKNPKKIDRIAVGCICTHKGKYLLFHRAKDRLWNSVTGNVEKGESPDQAVIRELKEKIGFAAKPKFITTLYHKYGDAVVEYNLFNYDFKENPLDVLKLNKKEHSEMRLFSLDEALALNLYVDEDYCMKLHFKLSKKRNHSKVRK